jgi:hypothetical protein
MDGTTGCLKDWLAALKSCSRKAEMLKRERWREKAESGSAGGIYMWRPGSEWSREMIAEAAQAAAVAGIA